MKKGKLIGKIFAIAIVFALIVAMIGGVANTASATSEKTTIYVTDSSPWFTKGSNSGHPEYWQSYTYGGHTYIWTYVGGMSGNPSQPDCWAEFRPYLSQSGEYDVYACFYADPQNSHQVPHTIYYDGGSVTVSVNQYASSYFTWREVKLGTWNFAAGASTRVVVTDATGEPYDGYTTLNVDTIKFVGACPHSCWDRSALLGNELAALVRNHFTLGGVPQTGESIRVTAYAVAKAESGGNPSACGDNDRSIGLWQINIDAHPTYDKCLLFEEDYNANAAVEVSSYGTNWNPWCTYEETCYCSICTGTYRNHLTEARKHFYPKVTSLSVSQTSITLGETVRIYYSVSDDVGLDRVELWRAVDVNGDGQPDWPSNPQATKPASSQSASGYFDDSSHPSADTYWYGIHVVDNSGAPEAWNDERNSRTGGSPGVFGPIQVEVISANSQPQLSNGHVEPSNGTPSTNFYYYVTYFDPDGDSPSVKQVYMDGIAYTMTWYSGLNSHITYRYGPKNLSVEGTHYYFFYFEDGKGGTARLPSGVDMYLGPTVHDVLSLLWCDVSPNPTEMGHETDFTAEATGGIPPYSWLWTIEGTVVATSQNTAYTFATAGDYTVCVNVTDSLDNKAQCCKVVTVTEPNNSPNTPSNPSPANHDIDVSINADLSWSGGDPDVGDTVTYDVYFGTSSSPPLVSNDQSGITYDPGTLAHSTKYYWKIVATDNHGASTTGPLWDFTTLSVPADTTPPAAVIDLRAIAIDLSSTGFVYPTGIAPTLGNQQGMSYNYIDAPDARRYYNYAGWLANGDRGHYLENKYHIGQDIPADVWDPVYAITKGEIVRIHKSDDSWGMGNYGVFIRHRLSTGKEFLALYGHIRPLEDAPFFEGQEVEAGEVFAQVGPLSDTHLHFGTCDREDVPDTDIDPANPRNNIGWGRMGLNHWDKNWPDKTNYFVDPIKWMTTQTPELPLKPASVLLSWTAPADDGNDVGSGPASEYDIRYSTRPIETSEEWESATQCTGEPQPGDAGSIDSFMVIDLFPTTTYYFALKAYDEAGNPSGRSNVPWEITAGISWYLCSPADMIVTDPDGLTISKELNEIPGATYTEIDINGDGDPDDVVNIFNRKLGDYLIIVIPEPDASPTDTYALGVSADGVTIVLAENVRMVDIPTEGYTVRSTETDVRQIISPPAKCFIATSAYDTPMAEEIQILREFRDEYLLTNFVGQAMVDFYYKVSPPIAEFITEHPSLKPIVRAGLVPAVAVSTIAVNTTVTEKIVILSLLMLVSVALTVWATRRRSRGQEYT